MKTIKIRIITTVILAVLVLLVSAPSVLAYPPDNAAVLYYKAFMLYESPDNIGPMLWDYWKGNIELNEKIEEHLSRNQRVIKIVLDATRIDNCDWGLDYSQGTEVLLPPLHKARELFALLAAEATMQADRGDYRKALGRCMSIYRMARHLNERPIVCYLVAVAINAANHRCMIQILSDMPQDIDTLSWLKNQLAQIDSKSFSFKTCVDYENEVVMAFMIKDNIKGFLPVENWEVPPSVSKTAEKWLLAADEQFLASNRAYWKKLIGSIKATLDMPYLKAYVELQRLCEKPEKDIIENPDATLTTILLPAFNKSYNVGIRGKNLPNVIRAAIDIYIIKAKTGRLPDNLPAGMPPDLFSGKDFEYEVTKNGFVLRCRGKDLNKDEAYEYEFKIKK